MQKRPLVSVIIPTFNREVYVTPCLNSIKNQTYKNIEIIVVDQGSSDNTPKIAKSLGAKVISVARPKFYSPPSKSRNIGFRASKGEILIHLDSDMELTPKLVEEIVSIFKRGKYGALVIHEIDKTKGFWSMCKALERRCYWNNLKVEHARAVKREIFIKVKGYDEGLNSGDDLDVHKKYMKVSEVGFCKNVLYHNLGDLNFTKLMLKKYNYGRTAAKYFKKTNENVAIFFAEEFKCYARNYKLVFKDPVIGFGMLFMKLSEMTFGLLGHLSSTTHMNLHLGVYEK